MYQRTGIFRFKDCYVNHNIFNELATSYYKWQDDVDRYIVYSLIHRPRGLTKVNTWRCNVIYYGVRFAKFKSKMDKELELIRNPYRYNYGHYFVKEKYYE